MPSGHYPGRNIPTIASAICEMCKTVFIYKRYKNAVERRFCGTPCHMEFEREKRRKVPSDYDLLYDLYWEQNKTTIEIGKMFDTDHAVVKRRMNQLGIPRRKPGHSRFTTCFVEGCFEPVYKILHKGNGSYYGRRCFLHWVEHRHIWTVNNWKNIRSQAPERLERIAQTRIQKQQRRELNKWTQLLNKLRKAIQKHDRVAIQSLQQEFAQVETSVI